MNYDAADPEGVIRLRAQPGPQLTFLSTDADIAIFGGGAGGGKTFSLLLESCRHIDNPKYGGVIFRRTTPQLTQAGGLWEESFNVCMYIGGKPREQFHDWEFPSGATIKFSHMEHLKNRFDWKGAQIAFIGFDQLEDFEEEQFWYMLSRNRSTSGVKPYIRGTVNPDPDSFVASLIEWYIDPITGYAIEERSGVIRWFVRINDEIHWADTREELIHRFVTESGYPAEDIEPTSFTFIKSLLSDNQILMTKDPSYRRKLLAMSAVERARLLDGNWKIRDLGIIKREWFKIVSLAEVPRDATMVRWTDLAATQSGGDYTSSALVAEKDGTYYIVHVLRGQWSAGERDKLLLAQAREDARVWGNRVTQGVNRDPAGAGKAQTEAYIRMMAAFPTASETERGGDLVVRSAPFRSQAEAGNYRMVRGSWNGPVLAAMSGFPDGVDDDVSALSGAHKRLSTGGVIEWWKDRDTAKAQQATVAAAAGDFA